MASIRGPLLPIIRRGGAGGAGISTASWACDVHAVERDPLPGQQPPDDREGLLEARHPVVVGQAERAELLLVPARAESEHEAAATHLRERRGHPRDQPGWMERRAGHQRAELHALGAGRERGEQRPRVPGAASRPRRRRGRADGRPPRSSRSRPPPRPAPSRGTPASEPRARPQEAGSRPAPAAFWSIELALRIRSGRRRTFAAAYETNMYNGRRDRPSRAPAQRRLGRHRRHPERPLGLRAPQRHRRPTCGGPGGHRPEGPHAGRDGTVLPLGQCQA